jgi:glycosyltransferase A (GT-A) superfamily protein (DUF2064 family)
MKNNFRKSETQRYPGELAKREGVSINQLASSALGEKMAALMAQEYLEEKAQRGDRQKFENALAKIKDIEPQSDDRL